MLDQARKAGQQLPLPWKFTPTCCRPASLTATASRGQQHRHRGNPPPRVVIADFSQKLHDEFQIESPTQTNKATPYAAPTSSPVRLRRLPAAGASLRCPATTSMSIFDAALDAGIDLVHVRHEAAAVHMADAHGRLTGEAGVALVTGGPGHANAVGALYTALAAESPMVLLSGHAATWEIGRGGFQELRQAEMAKPVTKASWTAGSVESLGRDIGEAIRIACSGRRGPVHLSLPSDLLDARLDESAVTWPADGANARKQQKEADPARILTALAAAKRPIIFAGPQMSNANGRDLLAKLEAASGAPALILESPRGLADATLGALTDLAKRADLVVLLGKALDFSLKWAAAPSFAADVQVIAIDPDAALTDRAKRRKATRCSSPVSRIRPWPRKNSPPVLRGRRYRLARRSSAVPATRGASSWQDVVSRTPGRLHPAEVFRTIRPFVEHDPDTVLICDGGEFAQWGQSMLLGPAPSRQRRRRR